jgi:hypothetical protein
MTLKEFLIKNRAYRRFCKNTTNEGFSKEELDRFLADGNILAGFLFSDSPEDAQYWIKLYKQWRLIHNQ